MFSLVQLGIISIAFQIHIVLTNSENTLKVCTKDGKVHEVSTSKCSKGAWTPDPINVDCVCASGLWVLSEKFCDSDFYLVASQENECFKINRPIRRFLSLMNDQDLQSGNVHYFKGDLGGFKKFTKNLTLQSSNDPSYLVRFNDTDTPMYLRHEEGVTSKFWQKCFEPADEVDSIQVIRSDGASYVNAWSDCDELRDLKFGYGNSENAIWEFPMGSTWHSKYGQESLSQSCMTSCYPKVVQKGRAMDASENEVVSTEKMNNKIEDSKEEDIVSDDSYDANGEGDKDKDKDVMAERLRDNGRDTIKIIHHLKKWIVHNIKGPQVPYKEYKYLQLARIIFLKSCPEVDGQVLTNFIRLFRFLIHEAFSKTPDKYPENTDIRVHKRIVETLRKCFEDASPYKFEYDPSACPGQMGEAILTVSDLNGTKYGSKIEGKNMDDLTFKTGPVSDIVLETAWKVMLHAHYQCAEHFTEHPDDLSVMYVKLQEFLINPHIIFRWEHPGSYLTEVYGFMHPGFKFNKFAKAVDACVNAGHESSFYKDEWLRRPKDQQDYRKDAVMGRGMTLFGAQGVDIPTLFNGKGYCVNKFEDPLTWTKFNSAVNARCSQSQQ